MPQCTGLGESDDAPGQRKQSCKGGAFEVVEVRRWELESRSERGVGVCGEVRELLKQGAIPGTKGVFVLVVVGTMGREG